ncbi:MAG: hypothetical protein K9L57_08530 [Spirochaetaceae bacterium]|nr:hypothetical protein [Spirochaetaceae bacterium]
MARNDKLLEKDDPNDLSQYDGLIKKAFQAKRKIETGFIELAESIFEINQKKLYKLKYKTFSEFCEEELGFSRQTIYVYISILKLINNFPTFFPRETAVEYGHKKMRYITEGANAVDKKVTDDAERNEVKVSIFRSISPSMPSTEIEAKIEDIVSDI